MSEHEYLSTACIHIEHERCRKRCKFCSAQCTCRCHKEQMNKEDHYLEVVVLLVVIITCFVFLAAVFYDLFWS